MLKLQDQCVALQDLLMAVQAGSGWASWVVSLQLSPLQHLQSCSGSGQTWLSSDCLNQLSPSLGLDQASPLGLA